MAQFIRQWQDLQQGLGRAAELADGSTTQNSAYRIGQQGASLDEKPAIVRAVHVETLAVHGQVKVRVQQKPQPRALPGGQEAIDGGDVFRQAHGQPFFVQAHGDQNICGRGLGRLAFASPIRHMAAHARVAAMLFLAIFANDELGVEFFCSGFAVGFSVLRNGKDFASLLPAGHAQTSDVAQGE